MSLESDVDGIATFPIMRKYSLITTHSKDQEENLDVEKFLFEPYIIEG